METNSNESAQKLAEDLTSDKTIQTALCDGIKEQVGTTEGSCQITNVDTTSVTRRLSHQRRLQSTLWVVVVDYVLSLPANDVATSNLTLPHMQATKDSLLDYLNKELVDRGREPLLSLDPVALSTPAVTMSDGSEVTSTQAPLATAIRGDATATTSTIAGIIIGVVVLLLLCYVLYYCKKRRSGENPNDNAQENNVVEETPAALIAPSEDAEVVDPALESEGEAPVAVQDVIVGDKKNAKQTRV